MPPLPLPPPPPDQLSWESAGLPSRRSRVQTPAGPTLRVFKYLRRKCCLCNDICKWLDFLVCSDKEKKPQVLYHNTFTDLFMSDVKEPTPLFEKSRGRRPRGVAYLHGQGDRVGMCTLHGTCVSHSCPFPLDKSVSRKAVKN